MLKKFLGRLGLVVGSIIAFYALLVLGVFIPLMHQENFQDFLKNNINQRVLAPQNLKIDYAHMDISLLPLSLTLNNFQLFSSSGQATNKLQIQVSTPQAKIRVSFSRLLLGRIYLKEVRLQTPKIYTKLPFVTVPPESNPQTIIQNLKSIPLNTIGQFIRSIKIIKGELTFMPTLHETITIKNVNWTAGFSLSQILLDSDLHKIKYKNFNNEFIVESFQAKTYINPHRIILKKGKLVHKAGAIVLNSGSVHFGKSYAANGLEIGFSNDIKSLLEQTQWNTKFPDLDTFEGHTNITASFRGRWGQAPEGTAHIQTTGLKYKTIALDQVNLPIRLFEDHFQVTDGSAHGFYGKMNIPSLTIGFTSPFPIQASLAPHTIHFSQFMKLADITGCLSFFDLNGPVSVEGSISPFSIQGRLDLQATQFFVTQNMESAIDATKRVIQFPKASIKGTYQITEDLTTFKDFRIEVDKSLLEVNGTIVHDTVHVNLDVVSPHIDVGHLGKIGTLPISGNGSLTANLQVIDNNLLIKSNLELQATDVGSFHIPHFKSQAVYKDKKLHFQKVILKQEGVDIQGDVLVNIDDLITFTIQANVLQGNVLFLKKFLGPEHETYLNPLTQGIFFGSIFVKGPAITKKLEGYFQLQARNITYSGEYFSELFAKGTFQKAQMNFNKVWLQKGTAKIHVNGKLGKGPLYDLRIESDPIPLSAIQFISDYNASASGSALLEGSVQGPFDAPTFDFVLDIPRAILGSTELPNDIQIKLNSESKKIALHIFQDNSPWLQYEINTSGNKEFQLNLNLEDVPWLAILGLRFPHLLTKSAASKLKATGLIKGSLRNFYESTTGQIDLYQLEVSDPFNKLQLINPTQLVFKKGKGSLSQPLSLEDNKNRSLDINLHLSKKVPFFGSIQGQLDTHFIHVFTKVIDQIKGVLSGDLTIIKTSDAWQLKSSQGITSDQIVVQLPFMPEELRFTPFHVSLKQEQLLLKNLTGYLKEGLIKINGFVSFNSTNLNPQPHLDIKLTQSNLTLPEWMNGLYEGSLKLVPNGPNDKTPFLLKGKLNLLKGRNLQASFGQSAQTTDFEKFLTRKKPDKPSLSLDLDVDIQPESFQINYAFLRTPIGGSISLNQTPQDVKIKGSLHSTEGQLNFRNHEFNIHEFELKFEPKNIWKSRVFLQADATIQGYLIKLNVRGLLDSYDYEFTSVPYLPNRQVLALILFGRLHEELSQADQAELFQIDVGNAIIQQMPLTESLEKETGLQFKISPALNEDTNTSSISVRKKVSNNLEAQITTELGNDANRAFSLEYDVTRRVSIRGSLQEQNTRNLKIQTPQSQQRVGLDIRVKTEFD
jgi:hypothetical protein